MSGTPEWRQPKQHRPYVLVGAIDRAGNLFGRFASVDEAWRVAERVMARDPLENWRFSVLYRPQMAAWRGAA